MESQFETLDDYELTEKLSLENRQGDYESDEELREKLKLLEDRHQYDEWLKAAAEEEEEEEEEKEEDNLEDSFGSVKEEQLEKEKEQDLTPKQAKLQEPYESCLREIEEEERRRNKELLQKQKFKKRESSKSIQYDIPSQLNETEKVDELEPWKYIPSAEIEHRQRILTNLDHQLDFETAQVKSLQQAFDKRWEKINSSKKMIADALGKLTELEEACREKRQIANKITDKTNKEIQMENYQIQIQKKELEFLTSALKQCQERLENIYIFQEFLRQVKDESNGQFKTIRQVTDRFHILNNAKTRLMNYHWENEEDTFLANLELHRTTKTRNKNNLRQDIYLADLRMYHESNVNKLAALEEQLVLVKEAAASQCMLFGQLDLCIQNIYLQICKQIHLKPKTKYTKTKGRTKSTLFTQLEDIEDCMKQLRQLCKSIKGNLTSDSFAKANMEIDTRALYKERLKFKI